MAKNIEELIGTQKYARLRFGLGSDYPKGQQISYVLGHPSAEEEAQMPQRLDVACEAIRSFCLAGLELTMTQFNNK